MIYDKLTNHHLYPLGSAWNEACQFLAQATLDLAEGRHQLQGENLFAIVMGYETLAPAQAELESHRRYLDIQMLLAGREGVECHFSPDLQVLKPYDPSSDAALYHIPAHPQASFVLTPGHFLAFFPHDAHRPCLQLSSGAEPVRKVVIKVAVELLTLP